MFGDSWVAARVLHGRSRAQKSSHSILALLTSASNAQPGWVGDAPQAGCGQPWDGEAVKASQPRRASPSRLIPADSVTRGPVLRQRNGVGRPQNPLRKVDRGASGGLAVSGRQERGMCRLISAQRAPAWGLHRSQGLGEKVSSSVRLPSRRKAGSGEQHVSEEH